MKLIKQLFGRGDADDGGATGTAETCVHEALGSEAPSPEAPDPGRVGDEDPLATERCETCGSTMSPERARMLQQERVTRLRRTGF